MDKLILTMLDTSGIQNYIFHSNRLQENIGASELVYRATTFWAFQALHGLKHNVEFDDHQWSYTVAQIEKDDLDAEVIYAGGGNTFILFRDEEQARQTIEQLTRRILEEAPNLTAVAKHIGFDWDKDNLPRKREALLRKLAAHKQSRHPSVPLLGLGVSAVCQSTGLPAVRNDLGTVKIMEKDRRLRLQGQEEEPPRFISRETVAKLGWRDLATKRLEEILKEQLGGYKLPHDVDKLGRLQGDESYVAVIHADGNRMSEHLNKAVEDTTTPRAAINALRDFSRKVNNASIAALRYVVGLVKKAVDERRIPYEYDEETGKEYLPIRPLVFGGDDLTLLCNGQVGVSLAAAYLEAFEKAFQQEPIVKGLEDVHARAGVAIVKMHYPFARAYKLSEELASSAKKFIKENSSDCSALDWHYATGGLSGELDLIREREYKGRNGNPLTLRPVRLDPGNQKESGRYWRGGLESAILTFKNDPYWSKRKNKVVGLREPLRRGADAVSTYLLNFEVDVSKMPVIASGAEARTTGWANDRCIYFDAVEIFDQYLSLE